MPDSDRVRERWTERELWTAPRGSFRMPDGTILRKDRYGAPAPRSGEMTPAEAEAELRARRDEAMRGVFE